MAINDLGLDVEERDIRQSSDHANTLKGAMGRSTVPVLRTDSNETTEWLPESTDIVKHLYETYGDGQQPSLLASPVVPLVGKVIAVGFFAVGVLSSGGTQIGYFIAAVAAWVLGAYAPLLRRFF